MDWTKRGAPPPTFRTDPSDCGGEEYVAELLAKHQGNVAAAAREAGLPRNTLYAMMRRVGL